ncbi:hypothetical protein ACJJTC_000802 [Scirpophaga incertulas]
MSFVGTMKTYPPLSRADPAAGATHHTAKIESVNGSAGSNGDASVKRRSGVLALRTLERYVRVRAEKDGRRQSGTAAPITITWRAATALPTAAARATTRPLHHAARSAPVTLRCYPELALQSIFALPRPASAECTLCCPLAGSMSRECAA